MKISSRAEHLILDCSDVTSMKSFNSLGHCTHRFTPCPAGLAVALPVQNVCFCAAVLSYQANSSVHCRFYQAPNSLNGGWHPAGQPHRIPGPVAFCASARGPFSTPDAHNPNALPWLGAFWVVYFLF